MEGEELSLFVLTDGERVVPLPAGAGSQAAARRRRGPNTGGMGAYCPVSLVERSPELIDDVVERIVAADARARCARAARRSPGCSTSGLMLTADGPKVVEFNCRFGDPETQAVLPALADDATVFDADVRRSRAADALSGTASTRRRRARP